MSRRRRLIERDLNTGSGSPATAQTFGASAYPDPTNAVTYAPELPTRGVQNLQDAPYRMPTGGGGATGGYGATTNASGGTYNAYNVASGNAYDATQANEAYNT